MIATSLKNNNTTFTLNKMNFSQKKLN